MGKDFQDTHCPESWFVHITMSCLLLSFCKGNTCICLCVLKGSLEGQFSNWKYWLTVKSKRMARGQGWMRKVCHFFVSVGFWIILYWKKPPLPSEVIVKCDAMAEGALNQQFTNWLVMRITEDLSQRKDSRFGDLVAQWTAPSSAGAQVESLVRELRSTCLVAKKSKHKTEEI